MRKLLIAYTILTSSCLFSCKNETAEPAQKAMQTRDSSKNSSLVSCGNNLKPELLTCVETHSNNAENLSAMCSIVGSKVQTNSCDKSKFKRFCTQTFQTETNGVKTKWSADVYFPESNSTFCAGSKDLVANKQGTSNPTPPTPSPVPTPPNPSPTQPGLTLEQTEAAIKSYTVPFSAKAPAVRDLAFSREMYLTAFTKLKALKITYDALVLEIKARSDTSSAARERAISSIKYSFDSIDGELKLAENDYPARLRFIDRYELEVFGIGSTKGLWERCSLNATGLDCNRMKTIFYNPISKLQALTDEKLQVIEKRLEQVNHP